MIFFFLKEVLMNLKTFTFKIQHNNFIIGTMEIVSQNMFKARDIVEASLKEDTDYLLFEGQRLVCKRRNKEHQAV